MVQHPLGWNFVINFNFTRGFIHEFHKHYILSQFLVQFEHVMRVFFICMVEKEVPNVEEALPGPIEAANAGVYVLGTVCFLVVIMAFATQKKKKSLLGEWYTNYCWDWMVLLVCSFRPLKLDFLTQYISQVITKVNYSNLI